jgi:hypothetical protein
MLKRVEVFREGGFKDLTVNRFLVHDSPYMRVIDLVLLQISWRKRPSEIFVKSAYRNL